MRSCRSSKGDASRKNYDYYLSPVPLDALLSFGGAARIEAYFGELRQWDVEPSATGAADNVVATVKQLDDAPRFQRPKQAEKYARKHPGAQTTLYAIDRKSGKVLGYATPMPSRNGRTWKPRRWATRRSPSASSPTRSGDAAPVARRAPRRALRRG